MPRNPAVCPSSCRIRSRMPRSLGHNHRSSDRGAVAATSVEVGGVGEVAETQSHLFAVAKESKLVGCQEMRVVRLRWIGAARMDGCSQEETTDMVRSPWSGT